MNQNDWNEIKQRFPISESTARLNQDCASGICAAQPKPVERNPLDSALPRKDQGRSGVVQLFRITFTIYARRPCDWDGYHVKELQDMLIRASILLADDWCFLQGEVVSKKVHTKKEERTEIVITPVEPPRPKE